MTLLLIFKFIPQLGYALVPFLLPHRLSRAFSFPNLVKSRHTHTSLSGILI